MYRTICAELWTDPAIKSLDVPTKLLFVYLITNPHTHLCGIYYLPEQTGMRETGLKQIAYRYGIDTLCKLKKVYWDTYTETIFVVNMFEYQGKGSKNYAAAANHIATLHKSSLIQEFLSRYPQLVGMVSDKLRYPIDTLSHISPSVPDPDPDPVLLNSPNLNPDLQSKSETRKKRANGHAEEVPIPEDWLPSEQHRKQASALGLNLNIEAAHFKGKAKELNWTQKDWNLKFSNWMLQEVKFRQARRNA